MNNREISEFLKTIGDGKPDCDPPGIEADIRAGFRRATKDTDEIRQAIIEGEKQLLALRDKLKTTIGESQALATVLVKNEERRRAEPKEAPTDIREVSLVANGTGADHPPQP